MSKKAFNKKIIPVVIGLITAILSFSFNGITSYAQASEEAVEIQNDNKYGGGYAVTNQISGVGYSPYVYDASNGLPTSDAMYILGASDGHIWLGGYGGGFCYDGTTFEKQPYSDGFTSARCFMEDSRGRIWVGTNDSGVVVIDGKEKKHFTYSEGLTSNSIRSFAEDNNGRIFIGTTEGICYLDTDDTIKRIDDEKINTERILRLQADINGTIYGHTSSGIIFSIKDCNIAEIYTGKELGVSEISTILVDPLYAETIYFCTETGYMYHGRFGSPAKELNRISIRSLGTAHWLSYDCGRVWVSSTEKIGFINGDSTVELTNLPINNSIEMTTSDYQGNIWVASSTQGVMKLVANNFVDLTKSQQLPECVTNATYYDNGYLYVGTDNGLYILTDSRDLVKNELTDLLEGVRVRCITGDKDGNIWIATFSDNLGVVCYTADKEVTCYDVEDGLIDNSTRCICVTGGGFVVIGTSAGISIIENGKVIRNYGSQEELKNKVILTLEEGEDGEIYAGSDGDGIYVIKEDKIDKISIKDGLTSQVIPKLFWDDERKLLWIITSNSVEYMKDGVITNISSIPYTNNYDICFAGNDEAWILSSYGVYIVNSNELLSDTIEDFKLYTMSNGLPYVVSANSFNCMDENGNLYIAGRNGVIKVDVNNFYNGNSYIKAKLKSIYFDDTEILPDDGGLYILPNTEGRIRINASVMDYTLLNPVIHMYLDGTKDEGITVYRSELSGLEYTGLKYGYYNLHIQVYDNSGKNLLEDKVYGIVKKPHIYDILIVKIIFIFSVVMLAGFIVWRFMKSTIISRQYAEISKAKEDAERANSAKSRFLANMSHEIRTPINTILGMDEMILREDAKDVPKKYFMSMMNYAFDIKNATESLLGLINDLLDISKIESGKMHLVEQEYDVQELLRSIVSMIRVRSTQKELIFDVVVDEIMPKRLYGDAGKIKQIVLNLLTNAVKYTEKGGFILNVSMTERQDDICSLCFSVKDTGIGVKEEDMDKLFMAYERLDEEKNSGIQGTGLGLDISRRFAELMGGKLWCESVYGEGSEFILTIEQKIVDKTPLGAFIEHDENASGPYVPKFIAPDADVLVVDDNPMNLNVIKGLLKATKIFVTTAGSGEEALEKIKATSFNVVLLDHMMPGMDGIQTVAEIRKTNPDLPVYALTANSTAGEEFYKSKGFNGYLSKPVDTEVLERTILKHLPEAMVQKREEEEDTTELKDLPENMLWIENTEGISVEEGIKHSGGIESFIFSLKLFLDTIEDNAAVIMNAFENDDIRLYTIKVHALKSSARIIGAEELSELCRRLEEAGKKGDKDYIISNNDALISLYKSYEDKLNPLNEEDEDDSGKEQISESELNDAYEALKEMVPQMDYDAIEMIMEELKEYRLPAKDKERISKLNKLLKVYDWEEMEKVLNI